MREFKENQDMYSVPRLNGWTASILSNRAEELYRQEVIIETILNEIMREIWRCVEEEKTQCSVKFKDDTDNDLKLEVINRLEDMGYLVKIGVETEEEVQLFDEYTEMAENGDLSVIKMLEEVFDNSDSYVISWDKIG